jgi:hypothetical protein
MGCGVSSVQIHAGSDVPQSGASPILFAKKILRATYYVLVYLNQS